MAAHARTSAMPRARCKATAILVVILAAAVIGPLASAVDGSSGTGTQAEIQIASGVG